MTHRNSQYLALAATLVMLLLYVLNAAGLLGPNPIGQSATDTNPLIVPAGYAFAIWGLIYPLLIVFPVYQLIKNRNNHPDWIRLRQLFAVNVVSNGLWLGFASYDWLWTTVVIIVVMLGTLYRINVLLSSIKADGAAHSYWLERFVFSIYFAWVTLATVLNVSSALDFYDWAGFGIAEVTWTVLIIAVAVAITAATSFRFRDSAYAGVVVWAFVALAVKHWATLPLLGWIAAGVVFLFLGIVLRLRTSGNPQPVRS